ncbi:MAG: sugar ABC transporter ATP-binding protein [Bifidobacteriaceae bacterium]|nr:sugar ABC transporter ATP-binding protein [Bifidobacteriaceae bacterium]
MTKRYGGVHALVDGTLTAHRGEVHGILGENGAGKSTLVRVLAGVIRPNSGEVTLDGRTLRLGSTRQARASGVATVFQESSLVPALTVEENLLFGEWPRGWHRRIRRRAMRRHVLDIMTGLGGRRLAPKTQVGDLSLEDRQLLEVMKALSAQADVLILDEATAALTPEDASWVLAQARQAAAGGAIVLLVSHRMAEIRAACDRVTVLRSGSTVLSSPISEVSDDELITAMLGHRLEELYPQRNSEPGRQIVLRAEGLTVYGECGPLDFTMRQGEILGVFALPGQGQRGLLMSLCGALRHTGTLEFDGVRYRPRSPADGQRVGIYLVPEDRAREALFLGHTSQENITLSHLTADRLGMFIDSGKERAKATGTALAVGFDPKRLPDAVLTLSGGNQQKVVFGRAIMGNPKMLVLYDSTRGVDVGTKADVYRLISDLADNGVSVVFYSSDVAETVHVCDRILVMDGGRIVGETLHGQTDEEEILRLAVGGTLKGALP